MARKSKGQGQADTTTGASDSMPNVPTDVPAILSSDDPGNGNTIDASSKARKEKKPREVRYYLTGLGSDSQRVIIGEFGTLKQLHKYCDPLWGAITRGLRDIYIIKGKVVNEGP